MSNRGALTRAPFFCTARMIPELGHVSLILALELACLQSLCSLIGASRGNAAWMRIGSGAAYGQLPFALGGFTALVWAYYANDFSVLNVAEHSSRDLPLIYRLTAAWGSHEGSMLLWSIILSGWTVALNTSGKLPLAMKARVIGVLGCVSSGFLAFVLLTSNPFLRLDPPPADGMDLNPLLQDPGMILHPPLLYMGYVGFAIAFAFAIAAMLALEFEQDWARWSRNWTLTAWLFLTLGIAVGSWWAYYELGWGGWWFWDPTENASLIPWLIGTALLHSLAVTEQRKSLSRWSLLLAILTFSMCLVATFLVRSGVLSSVHAFAQDPARGLFILLFLALTVGGSLFLFAMRGAGLARTDPGPMRARDLWVLSGNVLILVAAATVLLGTLYPLVLDAMDLGKVSVGPPYFNAVFVPLMTPVLVLMGLGAHDGGPQTRLMPLLFRLRWRAAVAVLLGSVVPALYADWRWQAMLATTLAVWIVAGTVHSRVSAAPQYNRPWLRGVAMTIAHCGVALTIIGMGYVSAYEIERDVLMAPGDSAQIGDFTITLVGVNEVPGPNYAAAIAELNVVHKGQAVGRLAPEKRVYHASKKQMSESAIRYAASGDLYAALGEPLKNGAWSVRLFHKPLVIWIWLGALLMACGAGTAVLLRWRLGRGA